MFYNSLARFRDEQLENYQGQPLEYSASDYHHISRPGGRVRRGRSQTGQGNSKRRAKCPSSRDFPRRVSSIKEPMSSCTVESYDPYRSPKHHGMASEAQYAQITVHRELEETSAILSSPRANPPPSIVEEEEPEEPEVADSSPFTVLQKRNRGVSSVKSFKSSKVPHSSSRARGLTPHSMSYRRNVSFQHARNRSHGSTTAKSKKRKIMAPTQQNEFKRSPSTCSLQLLANGIDIPNMPSSPPLPAQPAMVRTNGPKVKSLQQVRKVRESDYTWREDTRKVSHELSQICEEAFNGSSVTTIRTTSAGSGYETPATPVSMASPEQDKPTPKAPVLENVQESTPLYNIKELTETRRKLIEHGRGRTDNIPAYLSGVITHLDRLIEEGQGPNNTRAHLDVGSIQDPFITSPNETALPATTHDFASLVSAPGEISPHRIHKGPASVTSSQGSDPKATIRMVPHSSLRSLEEVRPLTIRKKAHGKSALSEVHDLFLDDPKDSNRNFSNRSRHAAQPGGLAPIQEVPSSPKKNTVTRAPEGKKWSWFKHRPQNSDTPPALPPKDRDVIPSADTTVHKPITLESTSPPAVINTDRVPTRKTSMDRFGGTFLKKLMTKKSTRHTQQPSNGTCSLRHLGIIPDQSIAMEKDMENITGKDDRRSLMCSGFADTDSSIESDDPQNPVRTKRRSIANHNWFARVFQIKPATQVVALNTSKAKGCKELYKLLREWRDFGMEDVYLDKTNSVVHGRVSEANCKSFILLCPLLKLTIIQSSIFERSNSPLNSILSLSMADRPTLAWCASNRSAARRHHSPRSLKLCKARWHAAA